MPEPAPQSPESLSGQTISAPSSPAPASPAASPAGPSGATPPASPASTSPEVSSPGLGGGTGATPGTGGTPPATPAEYATVRETLRNYGLDLTTQFQDDHQALQYLVGMARQAQAQSELARYGQVYVQHADQFQAWMRERQEQTQAKQAQASQWWKPPEFDPSWQSKLTRDPATGEVRALPGNDPSVVQKYLAWAEHQRGFLERFSQDPVKAIQPGIEQLIDQRAQQLIQQHLGGYREQTQAQQLIQGNVGWIHEHDASGNVVRDPSSGQPMLSEWGRRYGSYVQRAEQMGLRGVQAQHDYAVGLVQRDYLAQRYAGQTQAQAAQTQGDAAKQAFLNQAQGGAGGLHQPSVGSTQAAGPNGAPVNPPANLTLRGLQEMMLKNFQAGGFQAGQEIQFAR